jgi:hypothetical protein
MMIRMGIEHAESVVTCYLFLSVTMGLCDLEVMNASSDLCVTS